jgi:uncharacterized membrane protein (UPF0127 family)
VYSDKKSLPAIWTLVSPLAPRARLSLWRAVGERRSAGSSLRISSVTSSLGTTVSPLGASETAPTISELRTMTFDNSEGEEVEMRVEIAHDASGRKQDLMGRTKLGESRGMLFVLEEQQRLSFWMKDTRIPLSIAYIDSEDRNVGIQDMKPLDDEPPDYTSAEPARCALEVNRGFFEEQGVEVGNKAELPAYFSLGVPRVLFLGSSARKFSEFIGNSSPTASVGRQHKVKSSK